MKDKKTFPTPNPNSDENLIKVKSCGICGSDTHLYETDEGVYNLFRFNRELPCIIGHDSSGIVEKQGAM